MIISESVLRSRIRSLLLEAQVYPLKKALEDIEFYRDFEVGEFEQIEQRLRSNWDRGYSKFSQVIKKDVINSEEPIDHILDAIDSFMPYYSRVGPKMQAEIGRGGLTSSNLRAYVEGQSSDKLNRTRTSKREECRRQVPIREGEECRDFEVIHADSDWTVVYPKTILGSMSWAVGLADGSEEKYEVDSAGTQVGRVGWCTAAYTNNRFDMYAGNMHMYYFVKNSGYNISDRYRRLCITWSKDEYSKEVQLRYSAGATVDANNSDLSKESVLSLISKEIIEKMRADASSKKSTSITEMSSKVTLPMVKQDIENLKDDPELLKQQLRIYAQHAKDPEVIRFFASYEDSRTRLAVTSRPDLPRDLVRQLVQDESEDVRAAIAGRSDLSEDLIGQLAQDESANVRAAIAGYSNLSEDLIGQLAQDESEDVRTRVARNINLSGDLIEQLAQDKNEYARGEIARRRDLPEDLIRQLAQDESNYVRSFIAHKRALPRDLVGQLAQDKAATVRAAIAARSDLSEDLIIHFAQDEMRQVRTTIARRSDLSEDLIRQFAQDEDEHVRGEIAKRSDLPEDLVRQFVRDTSFYVQSTIQYNNDVTLSKEDIEFLRKNNALINVDESFRVLKSYINMLLD